MSIDYFRQQVARLKPGQCLAICERELALCEPSSALAQFAFALDRRGSIEDRILEGIVGSSFEFSYERDPQKRVVVFCRLAHPLDDGRRASVSPDRAHFYTKEGRFWRPKQSA